MSQKISTILAVIIILLILSVPAIYLYFSLNGFKSVKNTGVVESNNTQKSQLSTLEEIESKIKTDYPETVSGVINFLGAGETFKATLTTDAGKVYTLWPVEPKSIYESFGAKDGVNIEVRAKSLDVTNLEWKSMKTF